MKMAKKMQHLVPLLLTFVILTRLAMCYKEFKGLQDLLETTTPTTAQRMRLTHSWKILEFAFDSEADREAAIKNGTYRPGAALPIDVDVYYGGTKPKVFVTTPRLERGVPMTLGYVTDKLSENGQHLIAPYPDWGWNTLGDNCDSLTGVFRVQIDECDRLWVMDTGVILGEGRPCPPQLLSFSLKTNKLLSRYRIPDDQFDPLLSLHVTVVADVRMKPNDYSKDKSCKDTFVYIADNQAHALIVYDHAAVRSWKIINPLFDPNPDDSKFYIHDKTFELMDGIIGMALGPVQPDGDRTLYFHSLASRVESHVPTSIIRNYELFHKNSRAASDAFKAFPTKRTTQSVAEAMDRNGVLYFGLMSDLAIGCWNSKQFPEFGGRNIHNVVVNEETLEFASGVKVLTAPDGRQVLWVLTSSFHRYLTGSMNINETNFRINAGFTQELVRGTVCDIDAVHNFPFAHRFPKLP
ncbi:protein yellow-like [Copidosoma floridanum]|uniref:protein yellow-like n=1 Tax=Copidosoma floridanum TaxID=29053 RepID=UPI0006C9C8E4|nr:protein yellow-like [Copidosoma floridanum]XP_014204781.1 protein yellow-like [Copidosoma floridanum]XP_014204790.1 protein yellow-like [Copidosoma floridanum]XP_014204797.1 protein yellow-like [Copidosoma floridanum]XP_014204806.1 protein yellow-like [Copidosoma floridanum]XP_014204815.1 protein yellow-like [Copidosoma floridanum]